MADLLTTTTQIDPAISTFYDRVLLKRAKPFLVWDKFAQRRPMPTKSGNTIKFRRYNALSPALVPLTEGVTPNAQQLSKTDITALLKQYGTYVEITDQVDLLNEDPVLTETAGILGENMGDTMDMIYRDIYAAGVSVYRAEGEATRGAIDAKPSNTDLDKIIKTLWTNKARYLAPMIKASTGVGTLPVRPAYYGICHTDAAQDFEAVTNFTTADKYSAQVGVQENEIGAYKCIRFIMSPNGKIWADSGNAIGGSGCKSTSGTYVDVYGTVIFAADAVGVCPLEGNNAETITHPPGSGDDPLNQRSTMGWKGMTTGVILNDSWLIRYEHGASA